jgi:hypothetical protein
MKQGYYRDDQKVGDVIYFLFQGFEMKNENYLNTAVFMWGSLWIFYMFEVLSRIVFHQTDVRDHKLCLSVINFISMCMLRVVINPLRQD